MKLFTYELRAQIKTENATLRVADYPRLRFIANIKP